VLPSLSLCHPVQARFTEFETAGLAKLLPAFASHDYFDQALWDDVADSITYCNHYMAPSRIPLADVAALFKAYAKYEVRPVIAG
jgi:protein phosphatase 1 regulatory subunit 42